MLKKTSFFLLLVVLVLSITTLMMYVLPNSQESFAQSKKSLVDNKIPSSEKVRLSSLSSLIQLTFLKMDNRVIVVEIKNNSKKDVTAYQIELSNGSKILVDRSISGLYLKPDATYEQIIHLPISEIISEITLETAVFNDASADGNVTAANYIKERRLGIKRQLESLILILEELNTGNASSDVINFIETTKKKIEDLAVSNNSKNSKGFNDGLDDGKQSVKNVVNRLQENLSRNSTNSSFETYSEQIFELKEWLKRLRGGE